MKKLLFLLAILIFTGCDTFNGISRTAKISKLPDIALVAKRIQSYPEINKVEVKKIENSKSPDQNSIKETYYIIYEGGKKIKGVVEFSVDWKGCIVYKQYLLTLNRECPPEYIMATTPIMERVERDLETLFGLKSLRKNVQVWK